jgi:hypothetical protein
MKWGLKKPSNVFYSKAISMSAQAHISESIISGLKCLQVGILVFNGEDFSSIENRWSLGKSEPRSCTKISAWVIPYGQSHENDLSHPILQGHVACD